MVDFRFFINRQGPRGPQGLQGEKGDPGNTFTVSEGVNTPTEYTLIFDGGDGNQFETDNLRNPIVDRGGTYVRYDRDNVTQYIGEPDMAVIDETPGIVNLAGKDTVTPNASDAVAYELLEKTVDELNTALENLDGAVEGLDGRLDTAEGDISQAKSDIVGLDNRVTTNEGNIISLQSGKADKSTTYTKTEVNNALAGKANTVHTHTISQITDAGALASQNTVNYQTQVTNKPIIPAVGNGTITLTQGGVTKGTFTTNQSGNSTIELDAGGGSQLTGGNAINISDNVISVKYDGTTIGLNSSGQLQSLVEEPDMTQYYTKSQVDSLIPDISGKADSSDVGEMFQVAQTVTEKQNNCLFTDYTYESTNYTYATGISGAITESMMQGTYITLNFEVDEPYYDSSNNTLTYYNKNASVIKPIYAENILPGYILTPKSQEINYGYMTIGGVPMKVNNPFGMPSLEYLVTNGVQDGDNYVTTPKSVTGSPDATSAQYFVETFRDIERTYISESDNEAYITINNTTDAYMQSILTYCNVYKIKTRMNSGIQEVCFLQATNYSYNPSTQVGKLLFSGYGIQGTNGTAALGELGSLDSTVHQYLISSDTSYSGKLEITDAANCYFSDIDDIINPTTTTTIIPDYKWNNDRFAQYTDYASTQTAGLVKVGNNLSIAADGTLSADTQAPTAGSGISVSGTAVSVNVDNSTITINNDGQLTANIPTPATVDQTYNASSTNAQSGVAISGAGFMNGNIVQTPLEYLPDTTQSINTQNMTNLAFSGRNGATGGGHDNFKNVYLYDSVSGTNLEVDSDSTNVVNLESLHWMEFTLQGGIDVKAPGGKIGSSYYYVDVYPLFFGYYENDVFNPVCQVRLNSPEYYNTWQMKTFLNGAISNTYNSNGVSSAHTYTRFKLDGDTVRAGNDNDLYTINVTAEELAEIKKITTVRVIPVYNGFYNPAQLRADQTSVSFDGTTFPITNNGITLVGDLHPASLSLKYDSNTLGVNANNELYALSSSPSNMVTTDTNQTITGVKNITSLDIKGSNYTGGSFRLNSTGSIKYLGNGTSESESYSSISPYSLSVIRGITGNVGLWSYGSNNTGIAYRNGSYYGKIQYYNGKYVISSSNTSDTKIYKVTGDIQIPTINTSTNFLLEKDMLDGTTISYNSTTGKISTASQQGVLPVSDDVMEIYTTNYTINGSPTITSDHVFSTTDGADSITSVVPFRSAAAATAHSLKFGCQFRPTASSHSNGEGIFCRDSNSDGIRISLNSSACVRFRTSINGSGVLDVTFSNTPLVQNTLYKLTAEIAAGASSGTGTLYTSSDDGTTWTTAETVTLGTNTPLAIGSGSSSLHYFGVNTPGPTLPFGGEILLDKMFLEEDGVIIWSPISSTGDITEIGKATTSEYGLAKIDGTTIKTDADGKLVATDTNTETFPKYASNVYTNYDNNTTKHTAPSDGYLCVNFELNAVETLYINAEKVGYGTRITGQFKVRSGDEFYISAAAAASPLLYRFYPAEEVSR